MNISHLRIENYLGIEEIDLNFKGKDKLVIEGGNGRGKTSILEAIENAMNSTSDRRPRKVKDGAEQAILLVELDDGTEIKRTIKVTGENKVEVKKDGLKVIKPETFLKNLFGGFTFNPVDFLQKKDKEQTEILLNLVPFFITPEECISWFGEVPPIDYRQHGLKALQELAEKYFYNKRAVANLEVKELENQIEALKEQLPDNYDPKEWENVSLAELYKDIEDKRKVNIAIEKANEFIDGWEEKEKSIENKYDLQIAEIEKIEALEIAQVKEKTTKEINDCKEAIADLEKAIENYRTKIKFLEEEKLESDLKAIKQIKAVEKSNIFENKALELKTEKETVEKAKDYLENNIKTENLESLVEQASNTEKMKAFIPLSRNKQEAEKGYNTKLDIARKYDNYVEFCREKPKEILAQMELPVEGLGIDEVGNITINGRPIKNLSTAEQLNLAIDIAKATAGELKIICVDKFETLDEETQEEFFKKTENDNFKYVITKVTGGELKIK